jgi:hypothetical protein
MSKIRTLNVVWVLALLLALVIGLGLARLEQAQAQVAIYVDDDTCPATGSGTQGSPYCRIQDAVNAASDDYEIRVAAGVYTGTQTVAIQQFEGVYTYTQVVVITKSLILQGGYSPANWYTPDPIANPTIINAQQHGRGVSIVGTYNVHPQVTVDGFTITGGDYTGLGNPSGVTNQVCKDMGADCGGGLYAYESALTLRNSVITGNVASHTTGQGGGIFVWNSSGRNSIENTVVISNTAGGIYGLGGGLYAQRVYQPFTISGSTFQDNVADGGGGGVIFASNVEASVTISETDFLGNRAAQNKGGGAYFRLTQNGDLLRMDRVHFQNNQAQSEAAALYLDSAGPYSPKARLTNLLFTGNSLTSASAKDAIVSTRGTFASLEVELAHVTAADNSATTFLYAETSNFNPVTVTVTLTNTLLSFFTNAFAADEIGGGNLVIEHTNTLHQYVTNLHQAVTGSPTFTATSAFTGDPKLNSSYHLTSGSAAIDAGVDAGVSTDLDGQPRPSGAAPDVGADEFVLFKIYLPVVVRGQ